MTFILIRKLLRDVRPALIDTSAAFVSLLAAMNNGGVRLLDDPALLRELSRLERRPTAGGPSRN